MKHDYSEPVLSGDWLSWESEFLEQSWWDHHVPFLAWLVNTLEPSLSTEVGSWTGESFRALCEIVFRFAPGGKLVGVDIDHADSGPLSLKDDESSTNSLLSDCNIICPGVASITRVDLERLPDAFDDASIELLHISLRTPLAQLAFDISPLLPKLRDGAVIVIAGPQNLISISTVWRRLTERYPSVMLDLPNRVGLLQVPRHGETQLVDLISAQLTPLSELFRLLGDRLEHRHEVDELRTERDVLLAKLAYQATGYERKLAALDLQHKTDMATLQRRTEDLDSQVKEILATWSWRLTRPLRFVQDRRLRRRADFISRPPDSSEISAHRE